MIIFNIFENGEKTTTRRMSLYKCKSIKRTISDITISHDEIVDIMKEDFEKSLIEKKFIDIELEEFMELDKKYDYSYRGHQIDLTTEEEWESLLDYAKKKFNCGKKEVVLNLRYNYMRNVAVFVFSKQEDINLEETENNSETSNEIKCTFRTFSNLNTLETLNKVEGTFNNLNTRPYKNSDTFESHNINKNVGLDTCFNYPVKCTKSFGRCDVKNCAPE